MLNFQVIHGRLTADPELKKTESDVVFCIFSVAVDRPYKQGDQKLTDFFNCIAWRWRGEMIAKYFKKGKEIIAWGEMNDNVYEKDGKTLHWWQLKVDGVDFCGKKENSDQTQENMGVPEGFQKVLDDDIPF